ncbi:MAG: hypothetical protein WCT36_03735 [Candidatus Gracilibacteria bacterium]|jgi:Na+-transporting NADH:ubiquinone oxidoreductase subunit NqrC
MKNKFLFTALVFALVATLSLTGCAKSLTPEEQAQQALDQQTLNRAIDMQKSEFCESIKDVKTKEICVAMVGELKDKNTAISFKDLNKCAQLKTDSIKQSCEIEIKALIDVDEKDKQETDYANEQNGKMGAIVRSGDVSKCKDLKEYYWIQTCENIFKGKK